MTFPQLVEQAFQIDLPNDPTQVDLEGWVLALSMSKAKAFGPYLPSDIMTGVCINTASEIWHQTKAVKSGEIEFKSLRFCQGFHSLCDWCDFKSDCPKFKAIDLNDSSYNDLLIEFDKLKQSKKELSAEISDHEERIRDFYASGDFEGQWLNSGDYKFRCSEVAGRRSLDQQLLESVLQEELGSERTQELLGACQKVGKAYSKLTISNNKTK
jgi:hypothetical protein